MTVYEAIKNMPRESMARLLNAIDVVGFITDIVCGENCPRKFLGCGNTCAYDHINDTYLDFLSMDAKCAIHLCTEKAALEAGTSKTADVNNTTESITESERDVNV